MQMTYSQAITHAYELHKEFVSERDIIMGKGFDLKRIHASLLQEFRWTRKTPGRMTPAAFSEIRGKLILLGKVRKAMAA